MADYKSSYTGQEIDAGIAKANTALQEHQDISGKVDKVEGKQLSTNDFTNEEKAKLDNIDMSEKQDTLVSGTNIKTINGNSVLGSGNLVIEGGSGGLSSVAHDETLTGAGTNENPLGVDTTEIATKDDLDEKQDTLVSGENIKTINNQSILGSGNLDIEGGEGSSDLIVSDTIGDNALEFADEEGHIVMIIDNQGNIKTKTFNSSSTADTPSQLTDMIYELHRRTAANTEFPVFSIKGNVLVIGDSTIAGTNVGTKISALMNIATGYTLTDISQGGDTIQGQTGKYNNLSSSVKANINYAVIQIGLNDVYPASANLNDLKAKYRTLVNTIKTNSPNAYIVISCMLPCRARWQALVPTTADHAQQMWAGLNQSIIDNEYGANAVASIHQWALAYDNFTLRPEYNTGDKIHENKAGQQVILLSWLSAMFNNNTINKGGNN